MRFYLTLWKILILNGNEILKCRKRGKVLGNLVESKLNSIISFFGLLTFTLTCKGKLKKGLV